ncbi:unnamed protein product [Echinostoma caproni]|uniref:Zinc finger protein n=1 Tax=Echinostoma caproni TaxID=27848 RepID=A0A183AGA2_9TREM|nr:unnamed protein product [Echinostoma caproni]
MPEPLPGMGVTVQMQSRDSLELPDHAPSTSIGTAPSPVPSSDSETETPEIEADMSGAQPVGHETNLTAETDADSTRPIVVLPPSSSPAHSVESADSRSSGFSGFEQNDYMMELQLDDELSLPVAQPGGPAEQSTSHCTRSPPSTVVSEVCVPATNTTSPFH